MLTLHRLPVAYRVLYVGIAALLAVALLSHWWRLGLRHGVTPAAVVAWYRGDEAAMLFRKSAVEVAEDAWMNLFHHTLAFLVLGGLVARTDASPWAKGTVGALFGAGTVATAAGPPLVWWGVPSAAYAYVAMLALLSGLGVYVLGLVVRDGVVRRSEGHRGVPGSDVLAAGREGERTRGWWLGEAGRSARRGVVIAVFWTLSASASLPAQAGVYLTEQQAIREVFAEARWVATDTIRPDGAARAELEKTLGRPLAEPAFVFRWIYAQATPCDVQRATCNVFRGYAFVTEERGKYRPITMLIGVDTSFRVAGVRILVYREPRGGEVARQYFLRQYRGKDVGDPIRLNRDIINISGATISAHSVNAGVRKTLALAQRYYRDLPRPTPDALRPLETIP